MVLIDDPTEIAVAPGQSAARDSETTGTAAEWQDRAALGELAANIVGLLDELQVPAGRQVVDLAEQQFAPSKAPAFECPGIDVVPGTFTDVASLKATLDSIDGIGAMLLIDVLEHLAEPQELLSSLASWSLGHGSPRLLVVVPNVAHVDLALQILCGRFEIREAGALSPANLRFFTEDTLHRLLDRSGWRVVGRDDLHSLYSEQYDGGLRDGLPEEMVGALQATAQSVNPNWSVTHFVWALEPLPVDIAPSTYGEAVAPDDLELSPTIDPKATATVADYLASVGLVVSETNRRAVSAKRKLAAESSLSLPKKAVLKVVYSSPRRAAAFRRVYARLR